MLNSKPRTTVVSGSPGTVQAQKAAFHAKVSATSLAASNTTSNKPVVATTHSGASSAIKQRAQAFQGGGGGLVGPASAMSTGPRVSSINTARSNSSIFNKPGGVPSPSARESPSPVSPAAASVSPTVSRTRSSSSASSNSTTAASPTMTKHIPMTKPVPEEASAPEPTPTPLATKTSAKVVTPSTVPPATSSTEKVSSQVPTPTAAIQEKTLDTAAPAAGVAPVVQKGIAVEEKKSTENERVDAVVTLPTTTPSSAQQASPPTATPADIAVPTAAQTTPSENAVTRASPPAKDRLSSPPTSRPSSQKKSIKNYRQKFHWKHGGEKVEVTGTFDNWQRTIQMKKIPSTTDEYMAIVELDRTQNIQFKFVVDDVWRCSTEFPTEYDQSGNLNNVLIALDTGNEDNGPIH
ncbi:hypothetical protein BGW41_004237 [Actinomortierella wolfii]|nr:hypothetical protein BGW41_004237 [Actinomortierella wolfii]